MNFALSEEQEFFKKTIADTVDRMIVPKAQEIDEKDEFPWDLWRDFTGLGYIGLRYPEEIGGMNADKVMCMTFYEEVARGSVGFAQSVIMNILMGTYFIFRFGNEAIKERCLYPAMKGEKVSTMCFTEDQSGSDLGATRTTAVKDGDGWRINGTKMWITNGPICDFCTVLATSDPSKGLKGLNFFLVEKGTPVVEVKVDPETGQVEVVEAWVAQDVGYALNPKIIEGQFEGGFAMGGQGGMLTEFLQCHEGRVLTPTQLNYLVPLAIDMPKINNIIIETIDPNGPYGAKEGGMSVAISAAHAYCGAVSNALGVYFHDYPITPDKILNAIEEKKQLKKEG